MEHAQQALECVVSRNYLFSDIKHCITHIYNVGVITTSTCGTTISTNTSYIQNPGYTSSYTPTTTGTCAFTFSKMNDNICQLRLDFQTFSGFATSGTTAGTCSDTFAAAGQTGSNPPNICGTNTGYHSKIFTGHIPIICWCGLYSEQ